LTVLQRTRWRIAHSQWRAFLLGKTRVRLARIRHWQAVMEAQAQIMQWEMYAPGTVSGR
jgi:hypothetical protein